MSKILNKELIKNRLDVICYIQARNCNPNGDPDEENAPRQDVETGLGIITDVALKRRIRDYVQNLFEGVEGMDVYLKEGTNLNEKIAEHVAEAYGVDNNTKLCKKGENKKVEETKDIFCEKYWDARVFGGVLTTGKNGGQIQGAIQIGMASSLDPIDIERATITRMAYADPKEDFDTVEKFKESTNNKPLSDRRTMGNKYYIPYGLYEVKITVSANLGQKVGLTEKDVEIFLEALLQSYSFSPSSSKMGMEVISPIIVFKHVGTCQGNAEQNERESLLGCANAYQLFNLIDVHKKNDVEYPRDYTDYEASIDMSKVPTGVEVGFKRTPFGEVEWNPESDEWFNIKR